MKAGIRTLVLFAGIACILAQHSPLSAQGVVSFTAKNTVTSAPVRLDSILVKNHSRARQTTLIGKTSFDLSFFTGIGDPPAAGSFTVHQGFPNAFEQRTSFAVDLLARTRVDITVRSVAGFRVSGLSTELDAGPHRFTFTADRLSAGTYLVDVTAAAVTRSIKIMKLGSGRGTAGTIAYDGPGGMPALTKTPAAEIYTFIGYASGFVPDTMLYITPTGGSSYEFLMVPPPAVDGIATGAHVEVLRQTIPMSGGTANMNQAGCPINGMQISVPSNSYAEPRAFTVSWAPVTGHSFGGDFNPVSPMIRISNGGGIADSAMIIKIPISIPRDHFAMAFFYNEQTKGLEGVPILALATDTIWIMTRHFSDMERGLGKSGAGVHASYIDLIVSAVRTGALSGTISSGFTAGIDDWEFPNYGSFLASRGHCAGQSIAMMWYYAVKKPSLGKLYDRFDDVHTKDMWMDNPNGYKLCSVVQKDAHHPDEWYAAFISVGEKAYPTDSVHFLAFAYAIKMTGYPQFVGILREGGGHAMVVTGTAPGTLYIADPNFPAELRSISMSNGLFQPYTSKANAGEAPTVYPVIRYYAKTAFISFAGIAKRWTEFENKTIGTIEPNTFPASQIFLLDGTTETPVPDRLTVTSETVRMIAKCATCNSGWHSNRTSLTVFRENGTVIATLRPGTVTILEFTPFSGEFRYGFLVEGMAGSKWRYVDFRWVTITKQPQLTIQPAVATGKINEELTFIAHLNAPMPSQSTYAWNFGDGTRDVHVANDSTVKHTFAQSGTFTVTARLLDKNNAVLSTGSGSANIGSPFNGRWLYNSILVDENCPGGVGMKNALMTAEYVNGDLCMTFDWLPDITVCRGTVMTSATTFSMNWTTTNSGGTVFTNVGTGTFTDPNNVTIECTHSFKGKDAQGNLVDCTRRFTETMVRQ